MRRLAAASPLGVAGAAPRRGGPPGSAREFTVSISNVVGSRGPVTVLDRPVRSVRPVVEIGPGHALRVGAMSTGDALAFGMCVDPTIVDDVDRLVDGLGQEVALLTAAAR